MELKNLTFEVCGESHRELWLWLSEHPEKSKQDWPRWEENGGDVPVICAYCFPCYASSDCYHCPVFTVLHCTKAEYGEWLEEKSPSERSRLARIIAEKPWIYRRTDGTF